MDLSIKMPASQPATMDAKMPATMKSDEPPFPDEGKSDDAPVEVCSQTTPKTVEWASINDNGGMGWDVASDDQKGPTWELEDRKDESDEGALPQRDPDNDGDLN